MPELTRFLLRHALIGFGLAIPFTGLLLGLDVGGLRTLVLGSDIGIAAVLLLTFFVGLTFGSLQMAFAVWQVGKQGEAVPSREPDDDDRPLPD